MKTFELDHTTMNIIELDWTAKCWTATYYGPHAESILDLFNTNTLPTGFSPDASAGEVCAAIQGMNPDVIVFVPIR